MTFFLLLFYPGPDQVGLTAKEQRPPGKKEVKSVNYGKLPVNSVFSRRIAELILYAAN
jgi:hypothetical protein